MKNEILELTKEEIEKIKKQFSSMTKIDEKTVVVKDWLDDSIQIVKLK